MAMTCDWIPSYFILLSRITELIQKKKRTQMMMISICFSLEKRSFRSEDFIFKNDKVFFLKLDRKKFFLI
jgi:hypothetical protein